MRLHPFYLALFVVIAAFIYFKRKHQPEMKSGFWGWLFPKDMYLHKSHILDMKLFVFGRALSISGMLNVFFIQTAFAALAMQAVMTMTGRGETVIEQTPLTLTLAAFIMVVSADFCIYWVHRLHHEWRVIWPFHALHHSAEVLTPVTVYRKHPIYGLISGMVKAVIVGSIQGTLLYLLVGSFDIATILGVNVFYFMFHALGSNFRHSHVWISYGRALEHIFISPAQHQIHHSTDPKHYNKNYGEILAIWDWVFGTLYVTERQETISFGLTKKDAQGLHLIQPHATFKDALFVPFRDSGRAIKRRVRKLSQRFRA